MKIAIVSVMLLAWLVAVSTEAQQVCPPGIPTTTPTGDFTDHGDGTVTHRRTGLMWKRCVEGVGGTDCSSGAATSHTWQQALQLAEAHSFAGHGDWRLPNIKELTSIVESSCYKPAINLGVFPNAPGSVVWSGSPLVELPEMAWYVSFYAGLLHADDRSISYHLRLIRDGQ